VISASVGLFAAAALSGAVHIRSEYVGPEWRRRLCKSATIGALIAAVALALPTSPLYYGYWIVAALLLSLAGDVMLLDKKQFLAGLAFFLLAHVAYCAAFISVLHATPNLIWLVALVPLGVLIVWYLRPGAGAYTGPIAAYAVAILAMVWLAIGVFEQTQSLSTGLSLGGALLFLSSDTVLAANRFRHPFAASQLVVLSTYYAAQMLLAASAVVRASPATVA
jgi:uncharacterized membrane protein YhhN